MLHWKIGKVATGSAVKLGSVGDAGESLEFVIALLHSFPSLFFISSWRIEYDAGKKIFLPVLLGRWHRGICYGILASLTLYWGKLEVELVTNNVKGVTRLVHCLVLTFWGISLGSVERVLFGKRINAVVDVIEEIKFIYDAPSTGNEKIKTVKSWQPYISVRLRIGLVFVIWCVWSIYTAVVIDLEIDIGQPGFYVNYTLETHRLWGLGLPIVEDFYELPWYSHLLGFWFLMSCIYVELYTYVIHLLPLVHAIVFYVVIKHTTERLDALAAKTNFRSGDLQRLFRIFDHVQKLCENMRRSIGPAIAGMCLACMPYHCIKLQDILDPKNTSSYSATVQVLIVVAVLGGFLCISAEAYAKVCAMGRRLEKVVSLTIFENLETRIDCHSKMQMILQNIHGRELGVGCDFFTVTYSFVGVLAGTVLTYSVIIFQDEPLPDNCRFVIENLTGWQTVYYYVTRNRQGDALRIYL